MTEPSDKSDGWSDTDTLLVLAGVSLLIVSFPALILGLMLEPLAKRKPRWLAIAALLGIGATALLRNVILGEMEAGYQAMGRVGVIQGGQALEAGWPHIRSWWMLAIRLAPTIALVADLARPKKVEELREREERRRERRRQRRERRARKAVGAPKLSRREPGFELGRHLDGEKLLPVRLRRAKLPLSRLHQTALVLGAPGSGKTETLLRLAYGVAQTTDWCVFVIDAKGDERTLRRFNSLMHAAGRRPSLFSRQPYDGWRGSARELANRLVQLIDWAEEGGGTYYRDLSVNLVRLACTAPTGPPRSSDDLLSRLEKQALIDVWAGRPQTNAIASFREEQIDACRQRYGSFFGAIDGQLDGAFAFEDADSAYLLLNELLYGEETTKLARFLIEDFKQFVAARNREGRQVLLMIDEFSAIADGARIVRVVEAVRSYGAACVLAPQAYEGMGGEQAAARVLNAAHTIFLHAVPEPEPVAQAAGTRIVIESSVKHEGGRSLEIGSARAQHEHKVSPNEVRSLLPGMCFVIGSGRAQKVQVAPAPEVPEAPMPQHEHTRTTSVDAPGEPIRL